MPHSTTCWTSPPERASAQLVDVAELLGHELGDVEPAEPVGDLGRIVLPRRVIAVPDVAEDVVGREILRLVADDGGERRRTVLVGVRRTLHPSLERLDGAPRSGLLGLDAERNARRRGHLRVRRELGAQRDGEDPGGFVAGIFATQQEHRNLRNASGGRSSLAASSRSCPSPSREQSRPGRDCSRTHPGQTHGTPAAIIDCTIAARAATTPEPGTFGRGSHAGDRARGERRYARGIDPHARSNCVPRWRCTRLPEPRPPRGVGRGQVESSARPDAHRRRRAAAARGRRPLPVGRGAPDRAGDALGLNHRASAPEFVQARRRPTSQLR